MDHASNSQHAIQSVIAGMRSALRVMAERFTEGFGAPGALVKRRDLFDDLRLRALRWLCDMEAMARRLLLLRASLFAPPQVSEARPAAPSAPEPRLRGCAPPWRNEGDPQTLYGAPEDSADWRVCFSIETPREAGWLCINPFADPRARRLSVSKQKPVPMAYWADDPRPIAERFEALLRVLDNPDYYAERLAARLHFWRGSNESRQNLLRSLCAKAQIANEAGLEDDSWASFSEARDMLLALFPMFLSVPPRALCWRPSG